MPMSVFRALGMLLQTQRYKKPVITIPKRPHTQATTNNHTPSCNHKQQQTTANNHTQPQTATNSHTLIQCHQTNTMPHKTANSLVAWLVACILFAASCLAPAFQVWMLEGCWLLFARVLMAVLQQGMPPLWPELPPCESTVCVCVCVSRFAVVCSCWSLLLWSVVVFVAFVVLVCCCCCVCGWCALTLLLALPCYRVSISNLHCRLLEGFARSA